MRTYGKLDVVGGAGGDYYFPLMVPPAEEDEGVDDLLEGEYRRGRDGFDGALGIQVHHLGQQPLDHRI